MPDSLVFVSWSLMMMKGLPYSSNASVPKEDMLTKGLGHLVRVQRVKKGVLRWKPGVWLSCKPHGSAGDFWKAPRAGKAEPSSINRVLLLHTLSPFYPEWRHTNNWTVITRPCKTIASFFMVNILREELKGCFFVQWYLPITFNLSLCLALAWIPLLI